MHVIKEVNAEQVDDSYGVKEEGLVHDESQVNLPENQGSAV